MACCALGLTPRGFSLDASLMMPASSSPSSRASSEVGLRADTARWPVLPRSQITQIGVHCKCPS